MDGKSFDKIFLRDFVASKVQVLKLVKKPPNSQPSMSLLLRPEEHTLDHFWPKKKEDSSLHDVCRTSSKDLRTNNFYPLLD